MRVALVGAVVLAACSDPSTSPADDLVVTATVTPAAVRLMDEVEVRVVVSNRGTRSRTIHPGNCEPAFLVSDRNGGLAGPRFPHTCIAIMIPPKELAPGEQHVLVGAWTADLDPGSYTLRGRVRARGVQGGFVESEPVPLAVTPYVAP